VTGFFAGANTVPCTISPCATIDVPRFNSEITTIFGSFYNAWLALYNNCALAGLESAIYNLQTS
jgi:hypothetical protein